MANLTEQEFLDIVEGTIQSINVWCTETLPVTVQAVTVPVMGIDGVDISDILQQIETLVLPIDNDLGSTIQLKVLTRVVRGTSPNMYYYFKVEPKDVSNYVTYSPTPNEIMQSAEVVLLPNLRNGSFYTSEYNIILNNAQENRTSDYLTISTSTTKAQVQDSLYSDTGWTNARYLGTSTNKQSYASIDSAILGSSFQATYYPRSTSDSEIINTDVSERSYLEYFHTDLALYPTYSIDPANLFEIIAGQPETDTAIIVNALQQNKPLKLYQPGDLILGSNSPEIMKVQSMTRYSAANDYIIQVIRGWDNTPPTALTANDPLSKVRTIRAFELEGNKPSPVRRGKLRIKDTGYILYLDRSGYVIGGIAP